MTLDPATWNGRAARQLRKLADKIEQEPAANRVGHFAVAFGRLDNAVNMIAHATETITCDRAIYVIQLDEAADPVAFRREFCRIKADKTLSLPQYNQDDPNSIGGTSQVVYVGSSCSTRNKKGNVRTGTTLTRLTQHLIKAPKGTYALNLGQWAKGLPGGIVVDVYNFPGDASRDVIVAVEDAVSCDLMPICGRRGIQR